MTTKYMQFEVSIHGLDVEDKEAAAQFMCGYIKSGVTAALRGNALGLFNARNEFDSDIEVNLAEWAGG
jgi:hypothetical protein